MWDFLMGWSDAIKPDNGAGFKCQNRRRGAMSKMQLDQIVDFNRFPLGDPSFRGLCRHALQSKGVLTMPGFATPEAIEEMAREGRENQHLVYARTEQHTVYLSPVDDTFAADHPRNRLVTSSKGCITDDQIPDGSPLRRLYDAPVFRAFICDVLEQAEVFEYADPQSSINLHYAESGQELGWHFDNSSFAITLMVQAPERGGAFEYVRDVRDADAGGMGFTMVGAVLDGDIPGQRLIAEPGTLVLFRGRNSLHRVAPNEGERTRMLAVLAYNSEPDVALSKAARMTFYGRVSQGIRP
jgi:hypothetical protein